ncbi:glutathione S-transferase N-terminal domain-containing protein [Aestuariispira ectoiniformans]|uniref:glutathione S-transferase N-terminal domain-containing protein n=1 Tax=Aestuariispira ectoiniformans TaxID=2775080 RepID=UPI00223C13B0|nr:glutathione S-transferase N-terminal domain-containing protein [Aestuariispira ectoiniformans]
MKLLYSPTSPYARKVLVQAHETGLMDRIEVVSVKPFEDDSLRETNPLGKVPALIREDGPALFDSTVICDYLDHLQGGEKLVPEGGEERWDILRLHATAQGVTDAALNLRQQAMREEATGTAVAKDWWVDRQYAAINAGLDLLDHEAATLDRSVSLASVASACALDYLQFRFADHPWRSGRSDLANWFDRFMDRPSMQATDPRKG